MKLFIGITAALFGVFLGGSAQQQSGDKITVPLTDPTRPVFLRASLISGSITVKGYEGKEVIVEERMRQGDDDEDESDREEKDARANRQGLHRIPNTSSGLSVEEEDNRVSISTSGRMAAHTFDVVIQVPRKTSMKLNTINDGDLQVSNVTGDLELSDINGKIRCSDISGSVVADALNGGITVTFSGVNQEKSMSFSSMNGDIDVTFPASLKATVRMKNEQGEIYSDFDIKMSASSSKVENNTEGRRGKYKVSMEKMMNGEINGGGADIVFKNFNGDILIRKGK